MRILIAGILLSASCLFAADPPSERIIEPNRKQMFLHGLRNTPKGPIIIGSRAPDAETARFIRQLSDILRESGYTVVTNDYSCRPVKFTMPEMQVPIAISGSRSSYAATNASALAKSFRQIGYLGVTMPVADKQEFPCADLGADDVVIFINNKFLWDENHRKRESSRRRRP